MSAHCKLYTQSNARATTGCLSFRPTLLLKHSVELRLLHRHFLALHCVFVHTLQILLVAYKQFHLVSIIVVTNICLLPSGGRLFHSQRSKKSCIHLGSKAQVLPAKFWYMGNISLLLDGIISSSPRSSVSIPSSNFRNINLRVLRNSRHWQGSEPICAGRGQSMDWPGVTVAILLA